jgi:hypothetical protein
MVSSVTTVGMVWLVWFMVFNATFNNISVTSGWTFGASVV